ncbi:MAG: hypothetical protein IJ060_01760 [Oscillospiraceae bacterium]|nr:hypothetical protein [Oscillospiraceae bacterium]
MTIPKTKKKKLALAAAFSAVLLLIVGVLLAYFAAKDKEPNLIGVGEDEISVTEIFTPPNQEQDYVYRKLVEIENTGTVPCYVRVRLEFSDSEIERAASFSADLRDTAPAPDDADYAAFAESFKSAQIGTGSDRYINNLPDGWVYVWDESPADPDVTHGYYYYTKPVAPGEATDALISWVRMHYDDTDSIRAHDVYVYAESVQTVDANSGEDYTADNENGWKNAWHNFAG